MLSQQDSGTGEQAEPVHKPIHMLSISDKNLCPNPIEYQLK